MDQKQIFEIIEKFDACQLSELQLTTENFSISLKSQKNTLEKTTQIENPIVENREKSKKKIEIITSPIVGTFYRAPAPDAPPYIEVGNEVKNGAALCVIEAMKIMNKLEAEFPCEVVAILAENGSMVEYGAPLFEVERR